MKVDDILTEDNGWEAVRKWLDKLFGLTTDLPSKLKRVKQGFDEKTGEHVIYLEYRAKAPFQQALLKPAKVKAIPDNQRKKK